MEELTQDVAGCVLVIVVDGTVVLTVVVRVLSAEIVLVVVVTVLGVLVTVDTLEIVVVDVVI